MTLIDLPVPDSPDPALLRAAGDAPVADAVVVLLHYGRPEDLALLDLLHAAGHRGAIAVLAVADEAGAAAERAVREFGDDPAVRRVCHAVVPVAPATAAAAARLGDDEHRLLQQWVARSPQAFESATDMAPGVATALLDRLGPLGARRALRLVRSGEGDTRAELAGALVRHSGLGELQELIGSRFLSRADALRTRSVLAGLDALMRATPPADDRCRLRYQLERVRAGAHELRELELLDVLRSGELPLPDEQRYAAERLLGGDGDGVCDRLGSRRRRDGRAGAGRGGRAGRPLAAGRGPPGRPGAGPGRRAGPGVDLRAAGGRDRDRCSAVRAECRARMNEGEDDDDVPTAPRAGCPAAVLAAAALLAGGCASGQPAAPAPARRPRRPRPRRPPPPSRPRPTEPPMPRARSPPPDRATNAFTYNPALAPEGAQIEVDVDHRGGSTEVRLDVDGSPAEPGLRRARARQRLRPDRRRRRPALPEPGRPGRGARASRRPTRPTPTRRTRSGSTCAPTATATASRARRCRSRSPTGRRRRVIHEAEATATAPGQAGTAGARLACITVPFR